jgi:hypothetical protein
VSTVPRPFTQTKAFHLSQILAELDRRASACIQLLGAGPGPGACEGTALPAATYAGDRRLRSAGPGDGLSAVPPLLVGLSFFAAAGVARSAGARRAGQPQTRRRVKRKPGA